MEVTFLLHGFQLPLRIESEHTIAEVKAAFEKSHGLAAAENRLYKGGSVLLNSKRVKDYDIIGGATLHVIPAKTATVASGQEAGAGQEGATKRVSVSYVGAARRTGNTWSKKGGDSDADLKKRDSLPGESLAAAVAAANMKTDEAATFSAASGISDARPGLRRLGTSQNLAAAIASAEGTAGVTAAEAAAEASPEPNLARIKNEILLSLPIGFNEELSLGEETTEEMDEWERRQDEQEQALQDEMDAILRQQELEEQAVAADVKENLVSGQDGAASFGESKAEEGIPAEWIQLEDMTYFCPRTRKGDSTAAVYLQSTAAYSHIQSTAAYSHIQSTAAYSHMQSTVAYSHMQSTAAYSHTSIPPFVTCRMCIQ
jgi:ubiquitin-like protein Nedd8